VGRGAHAVLAAAVLGTLTILAPAAGAARLVTVGEFDTPTYLTAPPGDTHRLFVTERAGTVRVVRDGVALPTPFLDVHEQVSTDGERGLFSIAFPPDYQASGRLYLYYTDLGGDIRIDEMRRSATSPDRADPATRRNVLVQDHSEFSNHNGGQLQFGPDGLLYAGLGDGGSGNDPHNNAQSLDTLLGKLIRIDPRAAGAQPYTVPSGNPFVGQPGARPEIYAYGLRNPWRFSFDRETGDLTIGDVGQNAVEEVDFALRGEGRGDNYGWRPFEGTLPNYPTESAPGHVPPVLERLHSEGVCSITGGYVVRDRSLGSLYGRYLHGDLCDPKLRSAVLAPDGASDDGPVGLSVDSLVSFGEDACARVYAASFGGPVYRLEPDVGSSECREANVAPALPGAGDGSAAAEPDATAPSLRLGGPRRQRALRRRYIVVTAACGEPCSLAATGSFSLARASRVCLRARATANAGQRVKLRLRLSRRTRKRLRRALARHRRPLVRVVVTAVDRAGNERTARHRVRIRR
jgi:hypothetical protein